MVHINLYHFNDTQQTCTNTLNYIELCKTGNHITNSRASLDVMVRRKICILPLPWIKCGPYHCSQLPYHLKIWSSDIGHMKRKIWKGFFRKTDERRKQRKNQNKKNRPDSTRHWKYIETGLKYTKGKNSR